MNKQADSGLQGSMVVNCSLKFCSNSVISILLKVNYFRVDKYERKKNIYVLMTQRDMYP